MSCGGVVFFFFKQNTAYEMRISDWSSDVCSSDLIGAGQMSRVISARIAGIKAHDAELTVAGAVMASDAFFLFRDGNHAAAEAVIAARIQPGSSILDHQVIAAAVEWQSLR